MESEKLKEMLGSLPDFSCPVLVAGGGKEARKECAKALLALLEGAPAPLTSPDVLLMEENPAPGVAEVREAVRLMRKAPAFLPLRAGVVENVSSLSEAAQDALLKDLEEPAKRSSWILFAPSFLGVPPAIKSRCHCYFVSPAFGGESEEAAAGEEILSRLFSLSSMSAAVKLAMEKGSQAKEAEDKKAFCFSLFSSLLLFCSRALEEKDGGLPAGGGASRLASSFSRSALMGFAEDVKESFDKISSNVSPQLVFESLFSSFLVRWRF
ncbi:MAG: hypothetical protein J6O87_03210 [Aeriscardovia sp.]|nr:hypothetical protein [Aeriscardovia sp.]